MSDIALIWNPAIGHGDFAVSQNDLTPDDGLRTALTLSLALDRAAQPGDTLPDGTIAKGGERGWWADEFADVDGDKIGSRLWLLERSKATPDIPPRAESYSREALQWILDDKVGTSLNVSSDFIRAAGGKPIGYFVAVEIPRPHQNPASFRFDHVWAAEAARI